MGDFVDEQLERDRKIETVRSVARFEEANEAIRPGPVEEDVKRPDEVPIVWGSVDRALRLPIPARAMAVEPNLPHWFVAGDPDYLRRNRYWRAFAVKVAEMRSTHERVQHHVNAFTNVKQDPQAQAMDFHLPPNVDGDLGSMTDRVQLPEQGGERLDRLFHPDNQLALTPEDRLAIDGVSSAVEEGQAQNVGVTRRSVYAADRKLSSALRFVASAVSRLEVAQLGYSSSVLLLSANDATKREASAQAKIDALRSELESTRTVIQRTASFFAMIGHLAQGGVGDAIEKVGELAGEVMSHARDAELAAAGAERTRAEVERATYLDEITRTAVRSGLVQVVEATYALGAQIDLVLVAVGERRSAYSDLGTSVGAAVPKEYEGSRRKLAAIPAALPFAEMVVAKAEAIREVAVLPSYNEAAGRGLGIAHAHAHPAAIPFIESSRDIVSARSYGESEEATWRRRRDELFKTTNQMVGPRFEPTKDG